MGQKLSTLARQRPDLKRIFDVDIKTPAGRSLMEITGKPVGLPTVSIYKGSDLIFSKPLPVRLFGEVVDILDSYAATPADAEAADGAAAAGTETDVAAPSSSGAAEGGGLFSGLWGRRKG